MVASLADLPLAPFYVECTTNRPKATSRGRRMRTQRRDWWASLHMAGLRRRVAKRSGDHPLVAGYPKGPFRGSLPQRAVPWPVTAEGRSMLELINVSGAV